MKFFSSIYLNKIIYYIIGGAAMMFVLSFFYPRIFKIGGLMLLLLGIALLLDVFLLFIKRKGFSAERITTDRFSIGDENKVTIRLINHYPFPVHVRVVDELPYQLPGKKMDTQG